MEKEREQSKFIIQRFDTYISGANTKGNFLLAFNTFLCGGIISNYKNLIGLIEDPSDIIYLNIFLFILFVVGLLTTVLIMNAVYPFLNSGNSSKEKYHSLVFFKSIAEYNNAKIFIEAYQKQLDKEVEEDLAHQAYELSKGLKSKYRMLAWSMRLVFLELILLFITLIIITVY